MKVRDVIDPYYDKIKQLRLEAIDAVQNALAEAHLADKVIHKASNKVGYIKVCTHHSFIECRFYELTAKGDVSKRAYAYVGSYSNIENEYAPYEEVVNDRD